MTCARLYSRYGTRRIRASHGSWAVVSPDGATNPYSLRMQVPCSAELHNAILRESLGVTGGVR